MEMVQRDLGAGIVRRRVVFVATGIGNKRSPNVNRSVGN